MSSVALSVAPGVGGRRWNPEMVLISSEVVIHVLASLDRIAECRTEAGLSEVLILSTNVVFTRTSPPVSSMAQTSGTALASWRAFLNNLSGAGVADKENAT
jgi:hypothetical protein